MRRIQWTLTKNYVKWLRKEARRVLEEKIHQMSEKTHQLSSSEWTHNV